MSKPEKMYQQSSTTESSDQALATFITAVDEKKETMGDENVEKSGMGDSRGDTSYAFH